MLISAAPREDDVPLQPGKRQRQKATARETATGSVQHGLYCTGTDCNAQHSYIYIVCTVRAQTLYCTSSCAAFET